MSALYDRARIDPQVLKEAADWYAEYSADDWSGKAASQWREWLARSEQHRTAWERVRLLDQCLGELPPEPSSVALSAAGGSRRRMLKGALGLVLAAPVALTSWRSLVGRADYRTAVGQRQHRTLADGSELWLNTDTAVDIAFTANERRLRLQSGEIAVTTGSDPRPMVVEVASGEVQPIGTVFSVHEQTSKAQVRVYEGRVALTTRQGQQRMLEVGQGTILKAGGFTELRPVDGQRPDWSRGLIVADGLPLGDFVNELSRYRRGYLGIAPELANIRLVGAYPLDDTDLILSALEQSLPLRVVQITPWWTRLQPR